MVAARPFPPLGSRCSSVQEHRPSLFGKINKWPIFGSRDEFPPNRILKDVVRFLAAALMTPQSVFEKSLCQTIPNCFAVHSFHLLTTVRMGLPEGGKLSNACK